MLTTSFLLSGTYMITEYKLLNFHLKVQSLRQFVLCFYGLLTPMSRFLLLLSLFLSLLFLTAAHGGHDDDDSGDNMVDSHVKLRSRSLILAKIWCLIVIFIGTFIAGVSPYFLKWNEGFLVLGTQFAGGVFLGTALMHFLSDANETFEDLTSKEYPFAFMLACAGYLMTMLADAVISYVYGKRNGEANRDIELQGNAGQGKGGYNSSTAQSHRQVDNAPDAASAKSMLVTVSSFGDSILLIIALCFHSVFEGIAIGVSETKADAWKALWTISLHKPTLLLLLFQVQLAWPLEL
uniref:Zinc transporter 11 family protein n=1 Tax=Rhizophora mucronata TaxID=61149 RepID=A0A2P2IMQ5_RHIMU